MLEDIMTIKIISETELRKLIRKEILSEMPVIPGLEHGKDGKRIPTVEQFKVKISISLKQIENLPPGEGLHSHAMNLVRWDIGNTIRFDNIDEFRLEVASYYKKLRSKFLQHINTQLKYYEESLAKRGSVKMNEIKPAMNAEGYPVVFLDYVEGAVRNISDHQLVALQDVASTVIGKIR